MADRTRDKPMKNIPDDLSQKFVDASMAFAADLNEPLYIDDPKQSRMVRRIALRQNFVDAYLAIKDFEEGAKSQ